MLTYLTFAAVMAPDIPPPVHPKDRKLLRPLKSLGQPKTENAGVSFLRRTQYTAEDVGRARTDPTAPRSLVNHSVKKRRQTDASKDEPISILRSAIKSFDIANPSDAYKGPDIELKIRGFAPTTAEMDAWKKPVHPSNPKLKLVDAYPVLPDFDALTDSNGYVVAKFAGNPANATTSYDERMEVGLLHPIDLTPAQMAEYKSRCAAHEADPVNYPNPGLPTFDYHFFLPADIQTAKNMKKKFDVNNPERDDPKLYTNKGKSGQKDSFRLNHVRIYETGLQSSNGTHPYQEVVLALFDPELEDQMAATTAGDGSGRASPRQKGAYYLPIISKVQLKPRRSKHLAQMGLQASAVNVDDTEKIDAADLTVRELDETELDLRATYKASLGVVSETKA